MSWLEGKSAAYRRAYRKYQKVVGRVGDVVRAAARASGLPAEPAFAENFQGIEIPLKRDETGASTIVVTFSFGRPPRLAKTVEVKVSVFVENSPRRKDRSDRVSDSEVVVTGRFPLGRIPAAWFANAFRDAAVRAAALCTPENFGRLLAKLAEADPKKKRR